MPISRLVVCVAAILSPLSVSVTAQPLLPVSWPMLMDSQAQVYEDPYRDLSQSQMKKLMALATVQHQLASGELSVSDMADHNRRAAEIEEEFASQGLDANWVLGQRDAVAARRQNAAVATNSQLEGKLVELSGHFLNTTSIDSGEQVIYLVPDRGVCMHLPAPLPNQVIRLRVAKLPDPVGPCIAAAVRGRLSVEEAQHHIPSADGSVLMWSRWNMDVSEITTRGSLPAYTSSKSR